VYDVTLALVQLLDRLRRDALRLQIARGSPRREDAEAESGKLLYDRYGLGFVGVGDGGDHGAARGHVNAGGDHRLVEGARILGIQPHDLAGALHLRPVADVHLRQLGEGEDGRFDGDALLVRVEAGLVALLPQALAQHHVRGGFDHRNAGDLAQIRHGARGARIDLQHLRGIGLLINDELDVHQAAHFQAAGQQRSGAHDLIDDGVREGLRRIDGHAIARMDTGPLDMLHDARQQAVLAVADHIHFDFLAEDILIHQDRGFGRDVHSVGHVALQLLMAVDDLHRAPAEHIGGPHEHGIADLFRNLQCGVRAGHRPPRRFRDAQLTQHLLKAVAILSQVNGLVGAAEYLYACLMQRSGEIDGRLSAELHDNALRLLAVENVEHVLSGQRLEEEAVGGVEVGRDRFRVIVDDQGVVAGLAQRPDAMHRAIVELDSLPDAYRPRPDNDDFLAILPQKLFSVP